VSETPLTDASISSRTASVGYGTDRHEVMVDYVEVNDCRNIETYLREEIAELAAALRGFTKYFVSGNCIPVERAVICRDSPEVQRMLDLLARLDAEKHPRCQRIMRDGQPCGLTPPCPDCGRACHDVPEGS